MFTGGDMTHTKDEAFLEWYDNAHWGNEDFKEGCRRSWNAAVKQALTQALAAQPLPAREDWGPGPHEVHSLPAPVDWKTEYLKSVESGCSTLDELREARAELDALKKALAAPTVQEPVAMPENWFAGMPEEYRKEAWRVTTPPAAQRQWVGLTDEEIFSVLDNLQRKYNGPPTEDSRVVFALAIEAKLKEKNNG